jgi:hypothetical protein
VRRLYSAATAVAVLLAAAVSREQPQGQPMDRDEFSRGRTERFKTRVGFAKLATMGGPDGVRADWDELPRALAAELKDLKIEGPRTFSARSGHAESDWRWTRHGETVLTANISVFHNALAAQEGLLSMAENTNPVEIPYGAGPTNLGDLAIAGRETPFTVVIWVYRNVCVLVENHRSGIGLDRIARAVQAFMSAHHVPRLSEYLPRVHAVDVTPTRKTVHVGDELHVSIALSPETPPESVATQFREAIADLPPPFDPRLRQVAQEPLAVRYRAEHAGKTRVDISVVDRKTLLSPALSVTIDVLPAP